MFIELTDILRCPQPHDEQFLVLVPVEMAQRSVRKGRLGCPVCRREYPIVQGVVEFADGIPSGREHSDPPIPPAADALAAFLGLAGTGGYIGLVGSAVAAGADLIDAISGVHFVGVNPPAGPVELPMLSLVRADMVPIKSRSLRGVVLGAGYADQYSWREEAIRVVLPGLRVVGQGSPPTHPALELLASAGGWWVAQKD